MIILASTFIDMPVMGLQTGSELARTTRAVIDPATLVVVAYELKGPLLDVTPKLLRINDVRELSDLGMIVDSSDEFVDPDDVIKLGEIFRLGFPLLGMTVFDKKRHKLGKIIDFTIETGGFVIQQLTVRRPFLRSLNDTELLIHRSQIIEINNDGIIVHSEANVPEPELHEVVGSYVNPFRKSKPAAQQAKTKD